MTSRGNRTSRGKAIVNLLNLNNVRVTTSYRSANSGPTFSFLCDPEGHGLQGPACGTLTPRSTGNNVNQLKEGDELVDVKVTDGDTRGRATTRKGQSLRFHEEAVSPLHRNAMGVIGIRMRGKDELKAISLVDKDYLLTVTEAGYGKRTDFDEFRGHGRGTMGVRNILTDHNGGVVAAKAVSDEEEIILMSASGIVIRTKVSEISIQKRSTRGVRIMKMDYGDRVVGVAVLNPEMEDDEPQAEETMGPQDPGEPREMQDPRNRANPGIHNRKFFYSDG